MKHERPSRGIRQPRSSDYQDGSNLYGWKAALELILELEELPRVRICADNYENQLRLEAWLRESSVRHCLVDAIDDALDALGPRADA